jgi:outer membrane protein assembly factor BamD (BamD/ComL family)
MFFIKGVKKILNINNKDKKSKSKIDSSLDFIFGKLGKIINESKLIREKLQDLEKTNYDLGLKHIEKGNFKEALFRFKIVRKYWPKNYEAHLKLIYCCYLINNEEYAQKASKYLISLNPNFESKIFETKEEALLKIRDKSN